jgi:sigma54-dependent transcription regulator
MSQSMPADDLRDTLRQMVAVLQDERQALAGMDLDGIMGASMGKSDLCDRIEGGAITAIDEECRGLLETARRLNEVNRQIRNLIAANVAARLEAITGSPALYRTRGMTPAYAYTGARG